MKNTELSKLKKQINQLKIGLASLAIMIVGILSFSFTKNQNTVFDELTVGKLKVAGKNNIPRLILTHEIGTAKFDGVELPRMAPPKAAGIIYLDPKGNEVGGIGWGGEGNETFAVNKLDYTGTPIEAIGLRRIQSEGLNQAQLVIEDHPKEDIEIDAGKLADEIRTENYGSEVVKLQRQMVNRVTLGVENHNAELKIKDNMGRDRIVLSVDELNEPVIKILDEEGKVISKFPEN